MLRSMGILEELAQSSIRFSLGRRTTEDEVDYAAGKTLAVLRRLRSSAVPLRHRRLRCRPAGCSSRVLTLPNSMMPN